MLLLSTYINSAEYFLYVNMALILIYKYFKSQQCIYALFHFIKRSFIYIRYFEILKRVQIY